MASSSFIADFWSSTLFMTSNSASLREASCRASRKLSAMRFPMPEKSVELIAATKVFQEAFMPATLASQASPSRWLVCANLSAILRAAAPTAVHTARAPALNFISLESRPPEPDTSLPASCIPLEYSSFLSPSFIQRSPIFILPIPP